ncbi:MAG: hypothetical protein FWC51_00010 [Proteobacteria bacterium]|nr:hypothetical protein [Pseudomonadota bacterium]
MSHKTVKAITYGAALAMAAGAPFAANAANVVARAAAPKGIMARAANTTSVQKMPSLPTAFCPANSYGTCTPCPLGMVAPAGSTKSSDCVPETGTVSCTAGQKVENGKCVDCQQKGNPGMVWDAPGVSCAATRCVNVNEYAWSNAVPDQPRCMKKCDISRGQGAKLWNGTGWGPCGSGDWYMCDAGFKFQGQWHDNDGGTPCQPNDALSGACSLPAGQQPVSDNVSQIRKCNFPGGTAEQHCLNGKWTGCDLNQTCNPGYKKQSGPTVELWNTPNSFASEFLCVAAAGLSKPIINTPGYAM